MEPLTTKLKILLLNAENLFLLSDQQINSDHLKLDEIQWQKLSTSIYENKKLLKAKAIAKIFKEENPDIIMLCEVGGLESLKNYSRLFLEDQYSAALIEGNSDRNIDIGFLIRKNLGFYFDLVSNKGRSLNYLYPHERNAGALDPEKALPSKRFSRDAAELHLFLRNREQPFLVLLLTHLKSRLDPGNIDPNGFERRQAELKTLLEIYSELEGRFHRKVPILVAGDFNGQASKQTPDLEFSEIYQKTKLEDVCELAEIPREKRATYYQVGRSNRSEGRQLDYCFLSPAASAYLKKSSVHVYRYKDELGQEFDPPSTLDAKTQLPSDHYPLVFELEGLPLF